MDDKATLMMATYNRLDLTKQTLDNIFETTDYPFDLIIVDNNSVDGTVDYLYSFIEAQITKEPKYFKEFKLIRNEKNLGIAVARNQALMASTGDWLSTLDNDVLLPAKWLSDCIGVLQTNPRYAMMGVNMEGRSYPIVRNQKYTWQDKPAGNLGTACTVFNRSLHKLLGYFNTEYGLYGEEDADFGMRVRVAGFKMGYLSTNGCHVGEGENDVGEYREFKTASHQKNLALFRKNCGDYVHGKKSLYIKYP